MGTLATERIAKIKGAQAASVDDATTYSSLLVGSNIIYIYIYLFIFISILQVEGCEIETEICPW